MNINVNTKFNIGDAVFFIYIASKYNDLYNTETMWRVQTHALNNRIYVTYVIQDIKCTIMGNGKTHVEYCLSNDWIKEENIFITFQDAQEECNERNQED